MATKTNFEEGECTSDQDQDDLTYKRFLDSNKNIAKRSEIELSSNRAVSALSNSLQPSTCSPQGSQESGLDELSELGELDEDVLYLKLVALKSMADKFSKSDQTSNNVCPSVKSRKGVTDEKEGIDSCGSSNSMLDLIEEAEIARAKWNHIEENKKKHKTPTDQTSVFSIHSSPSIIYVSSDEIITLSDEENTVQSSKSKVLKKKKAKVHESPCNEAKISNFLAKIRNKTEVELTSSDVATAAAEEGELLTNNEDNTHIQDMSLSSFSSSDQESDAGGMPNRHSLHPPSLPPPLPSPSRRRNPFFGLSNPISVMDNRNMPTTALPPEFQYNVDHQHIPFEPRLQDFGLNNPIDNHMIPNQFYNSEAYQMFQQDHQAPSYYNSPVPIHMSGMGGWHQVPYGSELPPPIDDTGHYRYTDDGRTFIAIDAKTSNRPMVMTTRRRNSVSRGGRKRRNVVPGTRRKMGPKAKKRLMLAANAKANDQEKCSNLESIQSSDEEEDAAIVALRSKLIADLNGKRVDEAQSQDKSSVEKGTHTSDDDDLDELRNSLLLGLNNKNTEAINNKDVEVKSNLRDDDQKVEAFEAASEASTIGTISVSEKTCDQKVVASNVSIPSARVETYKPLDDKIETTRTPKVVTQHMKSAIIKSTSKKLIRKSSSNTTTILKKKNYQNNTNHESSVVAGVPLSIPPTLKTIRDENILKKHFPNLYKSVIIDGSNTVPPRRTNQKTDTLSDDTTSNEDERTDENHENQLKLQPSTHVTHKTSVKLLFTPAEKREILMNSNIKHLPKSKQVEYKMLVQRAKQLEIAKRKKASNSNKKERKVSNSKSVKGMTDENTIAKSDTVVIDSLSKYEILLNKESAVLNSMYSHFNKLKFSIDTLVKSIKVKESRVVKIKAALEKVKKKDEKCGESVQNEIVESCNLFHPAIQHILPLVRQKHSEKSSKTLADAEIDPDKPFCPFQLNGICNDDECEYQHFK